MTLKLLPISLRGANEYVAEHHRHHKPVHGAKFAIGASNGGQICGVVIVGRPVSRMLDDGDTLEVVRLCSDGSMNVCSFLYGAAWRAAKCLGYTTLITYTLPSEGGGSLRASGWKFVGERGGGDWNRASRPRAATAAHLLVKKSLWMVSTSV